MSAVLGRENRSTELKLSSLLRKNHMTGWRRNQPVFGKPDFIFPKARVALFVDGCFWHGCPLHGRVPKSRVAFWTSKIARNKERDREVQKALRQQGWRVVRVWEHELAKRNTPRLLARIRKVLMRVI